MENNINKPNKDNQDMLIILEELAYFGGFIPTSQEIEEARTAPKCVKPRSKLLKKEIKSYLDDEPGMQDLDDQLFIGKLIIIALFVYITLRVFCKK